MLLLLFDQILPRDRVQSIIDRRKVKQARRVFTSQVHKWRRMCVRVENEVTNELVHEDTALSPRITHHLGLSRVNDREQIGAHDQLVRLQVVLIEKLAIFQILIIGLREPLTQLFPLDEVSL